MGLEKRGFCGSWPNYRTPCTSSEGRLCDIFQDLRLLNESFWSVGFELRELSPGTLSLVQIPEAHCCSGKAKEKEAAKILHCLLTHHRCIVSVDLNDELLKRHQQMISGALRKCVSLRKLKLCMPGYATKASLRIVSRLPQFSQVQEVVLCGVPVDRRSAQGLSTFLADTRSLTTFNMADLYIGNENATVIMQGLKQNATITTLSVNTDLMCRKLSEGCSMLSGYLRVNKTLRTLSVKSSFRNSLSDLDVITGPLCHNTTLSELNLIGMNLDLCNYGLITGMLGKNQTLKRFHMVDCFHDDYSIDTNPGVRAFRDGSSPFHMWLVALAENEALEELTLDLSWIEPDDCDPLFKALARHASLRKVTIHNIGDNCVARSCRAIRDTGVRERFLVAKHHVSEDSVVELPECRELSSVGVDYSNSERECELLNNALLLLATCNHVKSVSIRMREASFKGSVSSLIVAYINNTTALRELDLSFIHQACTAFEPKQALLQALSNNKTIRRLSIDGTSFDEAETEMLTNMMLSSRTLRDVSLPNDYHSVLSLTRMLSTEISKNLSLLRIDVGPFDARCVGDKFAIADVARRNATLVMRAAHFVTGTRHKFCAAAAERVQLSPGLVMKVQELESIDEEEAVSRIKRSLKDIVSLDDFMRLAGVVKDTVSCHRRDDGQKQLSDLNFDCLLHIRQYLNLDDILNSK
ncbi:hypothetical protein HPB52_003992 [Rhipicephalus sanguineus]|uniref:Uncharacterized protein n=1 Tax=Rhipicephalus sanguineus TaxID=34632 RepID=A0A9D4PHQ9_RHISA|nr:hypothetical protein HPB52_003992 [Rhipicephalus sanguineus]